MPRARAVQFNIRSEFARTRAHELARQTGMTATEVVEDALRAYAPGANEVPPHGLVRRGSLLVIPARGRTITLEEANAALEAVRNREE